MNSFTPVPLIYTIGPMTAKTAWAWELNIRSAEDHGLIPLFVKNGFAVHCPQLNGRYLRDNVHYEDALRADKSVLLKSDGALVLPGWVGSTGSQEEIAFCEDRDIPVFFSLEDLLDAYACGGIPIR